jgi:DNA-binding beta-propeller fold protein YncE
MRRLLLFPLALAALIAGGATRNVQDQCGPFTDVAPAFCPYVLEIYYLGITAGTSPTTFSPDNPLTRGQAAVFVSKGINQALARSSRRAALGQWWTTTPHYDIGLGVTTVGAVPLGLACDGADVWVANQDDNTVSRVRASDGRLMETWTTSDPSPHRTLVALGKILVLTGGLDGGKLFAIDPSQAAGSATAVADISNGAISMAFDGSRIFVTNSGGIAHDVYLSIVTPAPTPPWPVQQIRNAGHSLAGSLVFDGINIWLANGSGELLRLDANGAILQTVQISPNLVFPAFDGTNLWAPSSSASDVSVVQAATGTVVATLSGNGLNVPRTAAFDGERVIVTNYAGNSLSLWRAVDLTPVGSLSTGDSSVPFGACSDGINFWISLSGRNQLARF